MSNSQAYSEFLSNRKKVALLLESAPNQMDQVSSKSQADLANTIYYSCALLLSSYLERYIESLIVEIIDTINSANLPLNKVPIRLRLAQLKESISSLSCVLEKNTGVQM